MRISTRGRYALEALLYLALLPENATASTRVIAESLGVSDGYLEQLVIPLKKANIVQGIRGAQGGYRAARPWHEIRVGDVLRAEEGSLEPVACLSSELCPSESICRSQHTWRDLFAIISETVDAITIADLASGYTAMEQEATAL